MFDFVVVGDATVDDFFFIDQASLSCDLNGDNCQLILKYGEKIPVEKRGVSLGGGGANVSVGLSRLGLKTVLATTFGDDMWGAWIKRELLKNNVELEFSVVGPGRESNSSAVIVFKGERTILTYHADLEKLIETIPKSQWLYLASSSGRRSGELFAKVLEAKEENPDLRVAFNPAMVDLQGETDNLMEVLAKTEALIFNWEEASALLRMTMGKDGAEKEENAQKMLEELYKLGPKMIVITDGVAGAYFWAKGDYGHLPIISAPVLETTGVGDAFASGFLGAVFYGMEMKKAMEWGMKNAASVVQKIGAIEGLLTKNEIS